MREGAPAEERVEADVPPVGQRHHERQVIGVEDVLDRLVGRDTEVEALRLKGIDDLLLRQRAGLAQQR